MNIGGVEVGGGNPCRFVAEISNNHNGSLVQAFKLIDAAKEAGADFIKFQCYSADELVALRGDGAAPEPWGSQGWTMRNLYEKAATPMPWFPALFQRARDVGLVPFSSVFGAESLAVLEAVDCPAYKIARLDNANRKLVTLIANFGKPYLISVGPNDVPLYRWDGHPDPEYVKRFRNPYQWAVAMESRLYCPVGYPQKAFDFNRGAAGTDYDDPGTDGTFGSNHLGFSYHGTDPTPCVVAATLGAKIIEAHLQLDDQPSELEANISLTASNFRLMVDDVRRVERYIA